MLKSTPARTAEGDETGGGAARLLRGGGGVGVNAEPVSPARGVTRGGGGLGRSGACDTDASSDTVVSVAEDCPSAGVAENNPADTLPEAAMLAGRRTKAAPPASAAASNAGPEAAEASLSLVTITLITRKKGHLKRKLKLTA